MSKSLATKDFEEAVFCAKSARYWRAQKAIAVRIGSTLSGSTAGQCETRARRYEARVREMAIRSEVALRCAAFAASARA